MHRVSRWAIVAIALMLPVSPAITLAASMSPVITPIAPQDQSSEGQLRARLDRLREQISGLEQQLAFMGARRETLVDQFEAADVRLALATRRLDLVQVRLLVLYQESQEREAAVERLTTELATAREELAARIVALYRMGPLSYSRFLLAADDAEEVLSNYQIVGRLASQDRSLVTTTRRSLADHRAAVAALRETTTQLAETRDQEDAAIRDLSARQDARRELIRQIDIEAAAGRQVLDEQQRSATALEEMLASVSAPPAPSGPAATAPTSGSAATPPATPPAAFAAARGTLPWPAEGPVTETFGRKQHPVYPTFTLVKGIEIGAGAGGPVHAVFAGRVVFADWFQNYGMMVVVNHGDEFVTIYGHLDVMRVRTNEWVEAGAEVGTVGETGSLIGPSLYFEIREGLEAVNPELWLRRR